MTTHATKLTLAPNVQDLRLRERARRVVPGGMYGHKNARHLPDGYPQFFTSGDGPFVRGAADERYIDLMCSWGPMLLGHHAPLVEEAVRTQMKAGDCFNGPSPRMVELAELMVDTVEHADWAMFCKNGTDATTLAVTIARAETGRSKVAIARGSYHGIAAWSAKPEAQGVADEERALTVRYDYNDIDSLTALVSEHAATLAAIVVTPLRHDVRRDLEPVDPEFARAMRRLCDQHGIVLVHDEIRTGLRTDPSGSWEQIGVRPDLSAWSKAIANGYPLACLMGSTSLEGAATRVTATGSFWLAAVPMAAAIATITEARKPEVQEAMHANGRILQDGLRAQAASHGLDVTVSGPPTIPFMTFAGDTDFTMASEWARAALQNGLYLHPTHNWFVGTTHTAEVMEQALQATDRAFDHATTVFGERP